MTSNEVSSLLPLHLKIQVQDTKGTSLAIQFDHFDVSKEDWVDTFKLILSFIGFDWVTIGQLFNEEDE